MNAREYVANFTRRILQEALSSAMPAHYERRAAQFEAVGTPRCSEAAHACRNAAEFWRRYGHELVVDELDMVLAEPEFTSRGWTA
ncbi:hypothetical protein D0Z08_19675 [Nocardioides immobilis]|uniref:Uncharacterized protein n=1 Tax=Nocardioides immobilis TaxID=2049295 RepID=A0A417XYK0_9ACTN|nr:hypothetical protein [Nocardioides immobilis]RHW25448.1 hypothetical protein D0Z08_19675 [Nocardioides immobilis]